MRSTEIDHLHYWNSCEYLHIQLTLHCNHTYKTKGNDDKHSFTSNCYPNIKNVENFEFNFTPDPFVHVITIMATEELISYYSVVCLLTPQFFSFLCGNCC